MLRDREGGAAIAGLSWRPMLARRPRARRQGRSMPAAPPPSSRTCGPSPSTTWCRATASPRATSCSPCRSAVTGARRAASAARPLQQSRACREAPTPRTTTIEAAGDLPMHLAHLQFYGYGTEGKRGISSAAAAARRDGEPPRRTSPSTSGQVMFGQTVTVSSDTLRQFAQRGFARPRKWTLWDGDGNGGGDLPARIPRAATSSTRCNGRSAWSCSC